MNVGKTFVERRRNRRVKVKATAMVFKNDVCLGLYAVENLSAGGALLTGGPTINRGEDMVVVLQLENRHRLRLRASSVHSRDASRENGSVGVAFHHENPYSEDVIQDAVHSALERAEASPTILVLDDCVEICHALERDLHALGCACVSATTPVEAVRWLQDPDTHIDSALIDLFLGDIDGLKILGFLERDYPTIKRVLMSGKVTSCQLNLALASKRAHAVLSKPWDRTSLRDVIGL